MTQIDVVEEQILLDDPVAELEKARDAAADLQRVEDEAKSEAETSVARDDWITDERASVEAAETAFEFDQAEINSAIAEGQVEQNIENWADDDDWDTDLDDDF